MVINPKRVLVFGDPMLDVWQQVEPSRISQEAPVIIGAHRSIQYSPGGACNVAVNCAKLGSTASFLGIRGTDRLASDRLSQALSDMGVRDLSISGSHWRTIQKHRVVDVQGRHLIRIDHEDCCDMTAEEQQILLEKLEDQIKQQDVLMVSDYNKGTCIDALTSKAIQEWRDAGKFVVVNGKPENVDSYRGASVLVLNRSEALVTLDLHGQRGKWPSDELPLKISSLFGQAVDSIVVTDGANGLYVSRGGAASDHFPAHKVETADVSGAGDTICATIASRGEISDDVLREAVLNAAKVVSQRGTAVP